MSYSYQSSSYSSGGYGGDAFSQADLNQDGRVDLGEFRNFVGQNAGAGVGLVSGGGAYGAGAYGAGAYGAGAYGAGAYGASGYGASSYDASTAVVGGGLYDAGATVVGGGLGVVGGGAVYDAGATLVGGGASYGAGYGSSTALLSGGGASYGAGYGGSTALLSGGASSVQWATDAQGNYADPNPQIITRPAAGGVQTYTQNIRVRFLQPPPVPPPGPLIIREVRPPQQPPLPPLRITQRAPSLPNPPPLVLRERPPQAPAVLPGGTVVRPLPPIPVPPRSVIIERLAPLPPRPRDIVIERWIPYGAQAKRQTIVQRAGAAQQYAAPRNVIIQYEAPQVRIARQFQRLGVTSYSPAAYLQQYGASLLDAGTLVSQARAAGVIEDITPPGFVGSSVGFGAGVYGQGLSAGASYGETVVGGGEYYSGGAGLVGGGLVSGGLVGGGLVSGGYASGGDFGYSGGYSSGGYSSGGYSSGGSLGYGGYGGGVVGTGSLLGNVADAAFVAGDLNASGTLDRAEFNNVVSGGGWDANLGTAF